ncbi:MAG TPA: PVC-type heme-binding CxxCH protein [Flavitalea sp.]|nr:PVC-type heme-binding CxxCH protein [Flavitalea sp.]
MNLFKIAALTNLLFLFVSCSDKNSDNKNTADTLSEEQRHHPQNALKVLTVADGLEVKMMASEPVLRNPTNIDVDDRGRIWVTEAFNYRPFRNSTVTPEGDRIMILEDKDGDGYAETHKVFYQGPEINAPLGICLIGNRVLISQSPYVWAFYDDNGDDSADRKEIIFQGISGEQHDHGMHAFTSGPDGKLYFNFGNAGVSLRDKNNKPVIDQYGDSIGSEKYRQGMVFRCEPDGSHVERLAHNFRNNYEVAVDSYGTMWQSDNDDDGNRGVRINYVMDYGNYGYTDEMTGAWWTAYRTNIEDSIPYKHWHLNDPGVVPNILQTGAGSPTGMVVYEGTLLPEKFRNQMIHCEPGQNVVRAYPVQKNGAGFTATIENILSGEKDQWFRPSDVCVAPDGSLIVADWYDPVVGGHDARDKESGRIYRIAPKGSKYIMPSFDYTTADGAVKALQNANLVVRRKAWAALEKMAGSAVPALEKLWTSNADNRMRARAFWALVKMPGGEKYIDGAIKESTPELRIAGLRAARELNANIIGVVKTLMNDKDVQVLRECAIALHKNKSAEAPKIWAELADKYDGKDRWYLEAIGIGAADQWDSFFGAYLTNHADPLQTAQGRDIVWRSRSDKSLPYLVKLATDERTDLKSRLRYFRAFDFNNTPEKTQAMLRMIASNKNNDVNLNAVLLQGLDAKVVQSSDVAKKALNNVVRSAYGTKTYIDLTQKYALKQESPALLKMALDKPEDNLAPEAMNLVFKFNRRDLASQIMKGRDTSQMAALLTAVSYTGDWNGMKLMQEIASNKKYSDSLRRHALRMLGRSWGGGDMVNSLIQSDKLAPQFIPAALEGIEGGPQKNLIIDAKQHLSKNDGGAPKEPFDRDAVLELNGSAHKGAEVFKTNCTTCHQVKSEGTDFGPKLSEIGTKLPKEALLDAIIDPSSGISFGYETTELVMKNGSSIKGLLAEKTKTDIGIKLPGGTINKVKTADVKLVKTLPVSMMPDLHETISKQDLADLLAYLGSLRKK